MSKTFFCFITLRANRPFAYFGIIVVTSPRRLRKEFIQTTGFCLTKNLWEVCRPQKIERFPCHQQLNCPVSLWRQRLYSAAVNRPNSSFSSPDKLLCHRYSHKNKQPEVKGSDNFCTSRVQILQIPSCEKTQLCLAQYITKDKGWLEPYSSTNIDPLIGKAVLETNAPVLGHLFHWNPLV